MKIIFEGILELLYLHSLKRGLVLILIKGEMPEWPKGTVC